VPSGTIVCFDYVALAVAPSLPSRAYAVTCGDVLRTDSADAACGNVSWTMTSAREDFSLSLRWSTHLLAVDPLNPDHFAYARINDLGVSRDAGASFTIRKLGSGGQPTAVLWDNMGNLYAGSLSSGVFRSGNDGATFEQLGLHGVGEVRALAWSTAGGGEGTIFAGTTDGLYRREPGGVFQRVLGGGGYVVSEVTVDPTCATRVYAGFGLDQTAMHRGGMALSVDGGLTWTSLSVGSEVHKTPVSSIRVHPGDPKHLYVATHGRGVWSFDHGVALPACQ
jgi:hypothetical protein